MKNQDYNRVVIILVLGIIASLWVMVNARQLIEPVIIYIIIGLVSIFFYLILPRWKI
jgi:hypothetical protein